MLGASSLNLYEISYIDFDVDRDVYPLGQRKVVGQREAKNGIEAIKEGLRSKGVDEADIAEARSIGSNKRLLLYGITFEAKKINQKGALA